MPRGLSWILGSMYTKTNPKDVKNKNDNIHKIEAQENRRTYTNIEEISFYIKINLAETRIHETIGLVKTPRILSCLKCDKLPDMLTLIVESLAFCHFFPIQMENASDF